MVFTALNVYISNGGCNNLVDLDKINAEIATPAVREENSCGWMSSRDHGFVPALAAGVSTTVSLHIQASISLALKFDQQFGLSRQRLQLAYHQHKKESSGRQRAG